jgi:translation initiation factor IF-3
LLQRLAEDVGELAFVEASPKQDGRNMTMVLAPNQKIAKTPKQQAAQQAEAEAAQPEPAS